MQVPGESSSELPEDDSYNPPLSSSQHPFLLFDEIDLVDVPPPPPPPPPLPPYSERRQSPPPPLLFPRLPPTIPRTMIYDVSRRPLHFSRFANLSSIDGVRGDSAYIFRSQKRSFSTVSGNDLNIPFLGPLVELDWRRHVKMNFTARDRIVGTPEPYCAVLCVGGCQLHAGVHHFNPNPPQTVEMVSSEDMSVLVVSSSQVIVSFAPQMVPTPNLPTNPIFRIVVSVVLRIERDVDRECYELEDCPHLILFADFYAIRYGSLAKIERTSGWPSCMILRTWAGRNLLPDNSPVFVEPPDLFPLPLLPPMPVAALPPPPPPPAPASATSLNRFESPPFPNRTPPRSVPLPTVPTASASSSFNYPLLDSELGKLSQAYVYLGTGVTFLRRLGSFEPGVGSVLFYDFRAVLEVGLMFHVVPELAKSAVRENSFSARLIYSRIGVVRKLGFEEFEDPEILATREFSIREGEESEKLSAGVGIVSETISPSEPICTMTLLRVGVGLLRGPLRDNGRKRNDIRSVTISVSSPFFKQEESVTFRVRSSRNARLRDIEVDRSNCSKWVLKGEELMDTDTNVEDAKRPLLMGGNAVTTEDGLLFEDECEEERGEEDQADVRIAVTSSGEPVTEVVLRPSVISLGKNVRRQENLSVKESTVREIRNFVKPLFFNESLRRTRFQTTYDSIMDCGVEEFEVFDLNELRREAERLKEAGEIRAAMKTMNKVIRFGERVSKVFSIDYLFVADVLCLFHDFDSALSLIRKGLSLEAEESTDCVDHYLSYAKGDMRYSQRLSTSSEELKLDIHEALDRDDLASRLVHLLETVRHLSEVRVLPETWCRSLLYRTTAKFLVEDYEGAKADVVRIPPPRSSAFVDPMRERGQVLLFLACCALRERDDAVGAHSRIVSLSSETEGFLWGCFSCSLLCAEDVLDYCTTLDLDSSPVRRLARRFLEIEAVGDDRFQLMERWLSGMVWIQSSFLSANGTSDAELRLCSFRWMAM